MNEFIVQDGKRLRLGYTTGSCAAAAAKAAGYMLLSGRRKDAITLTTPKGIVLDLSVLSIEMGDGFARCAIKKDAGDDPDVTNETLIFAEVRFSSGSGITIDGGVGVGRVTKRGLDQPVGNAAINSVPRRMIYENLAEVMRLFDYKGGLHVVISVPDGERLAKKTFNPRLGIVGGISILGTTGIVEPMSERALVDTIRVELNSKRACGAKYVLLTPGNYGADFIKTELGADPDTAVQTSNFIGESIDICTQLGFDGALIIGHIGKLVKLAGNMLNTHSKYGDCRMELIAAHSGACGVAGDIIREMLDCVACDDAVRLLIEKTDKCGEVLSRIAERAQLNLRHRAGDALSVELIMFSKEYGTLCQSSGADELLGLILSDNQEFTEA